MPSYYQPVIKVSGQEKQDLPDVLVEVIVETALFMPNHFSLLINDSKETYISSSAPFTLGAEVEISVKAIEAQASEPVVLMKGNVTALEVEYSAEGLPYLRVRGYDKSIRLSQGRKTRTYLQKKASDMISSIASENGVTIDVDATTEQFEHMIQFNQTDWDFLTYHARANGMLVYSNSTKLMVKKPASGTPAATLQMGSNLVSFEPRLSAVGQISKMDADGFSQKTKQLVTGQQASGTASPFQTTSNGNGKDKLSTVFSRTVDDRMAGLALATAGYATTVAKAEVLHRESKYVQAEGECIGTANLQAGVIVKVEDVGDLFAGNYIVSRARHEIHKGMHSVFFGATGSEPETLHSLLLPEAAPAPQRINGVVVGIVTNLNDPDKLGRVKVKYEWLKDASNPIESFWAPVAMPGAGNTRGIAFMPEINDQVLVAFEWGDINCPYIVGSLWNNTDKIPTGLLASSNDKVDQRVIQSRGGHTITLQDKQSEEQILVKSKSGHQILLDDKSGSEKVTVKDKSGNNSIEINSTSNTMTIKASGNLVLEAGQEVTIKGKTKVNIQSETGGATISAAGGQAKLDLQAGSSNLNGTNVSIQGTAQTAVKGNAMVQIQGGLVKIN